MTHHHPPQQNMLYENDDDDDEGGTITPQFDLLRENEQLRSMIYRILGSKLSTGADDTYSFGRATRADTYRLPLRV